MIPNRVIRQWSEHPGFAYFWPRGMDGTPIHKFCRRIGRFAASASHRKTAIAESLREDVGRWIPTNHAEMLQPGANPENTFAREAFNRGDSRDRTPSHMVH